jgi:hypothetical protein
MSGILDSKSRVLDTILTNEGKRQIARGDLKVQYISYSDVGTYYAKDLASGSADATVRLHFEQCSLPQDQITFEADDSGNIKPFNNENVIVKNGQMISYSFNALTASILTGSMQNVTILTGTEFASTAESLLNSSIDNFSKLQLIGTSDKLFEDDGFSVGNNDVTFVINDLIPISDETQRVASISHLESLFQDVRLCNAKNFAYLPPVNKNIPSSVNKKDYRETKQYQLGNYKPWGRTQINGLPPSQLEFELKHYEYSGCSRVITFDPTSLKNRIVGQFFEVGFDTMKKLDVIDYGQYTFNGSLKHAFFIGKIVLDDNDSQTFVHLFTLVFG